VVLGNDGAITPKAATAVLDSGIALFRDLPEQDRQALVELINRAAWEETDPERKLTAWEMPKTLDPLP
jgi:hypothetical protein